MAYQLAIGEKVSLIIYLFSMAICGMVISLIQGW
jgi:hypothetical protein